MKENNGGQKGERKRGENGEEAVGATWRKVAFWR